MSTALLLLGLGAIDRTEAQGGALSGDFKADVESRVTLHDDGTRTVYRRDRETLTLDAVTYESEESDVVIQRKEYNLDHTGHELRCISRDAKGNQMFTVLYSYDERTGRRNEEGTYDRAGKLQRVVAFPFDDGRAMRPVVIIFRQDGVLWTHESDGSGVVPLENQEAQTGLSNAELAGLVLEVVPEVGKATDREVRVAAQNETRSSGERSIDIIVSELDAEYTSEGMSPEALMRMEQWRREAEAQSAQGN